MDYFSLQKKVWECNKKEYSAEDALRILTEFTLYTPDNRKYNYEPSCILVSKYNPVMSDVLGTEVLDKEEILVPEASSLVGKRFFYDMDCLWEIDKNDSKGKCSYPDLIGILCGKFELNGSIIISYGLCILPEEMEIKAVVLKSSKLYAINVKEFCDGKEL